MSSDGFSIYYLILTEIFWMKSNERGHVEGSISDQPSRLSQLSDGGYEIQDPVLVLLEVRSCRRHC